MKDVVWFRKVDGKYRIFSLLNIILGVIACIGIGTIMTEKQIETSVFIIYLIMFILGTIILIFRNKKHMNLGLSILISIVQIIGGMLAVAIFIIYIVEKYVNPTDIALGNNTKTNTRTVVTPTPNSNSAKKSWSNDMHNDNLAKQYGYDDVQSAINDGVDVHGNKL